MDIFGALGLRRKRGLRSRMMGWVFILSGFIGCQESFRSDSPPGYDLNAPRKFIMGDALHEISGIVFLKGNDDSLYAIEDEDGKLFFFHPGGSRADFVKFGKKGDYEDVAILDNRTFVVLRSDGSLFAFPIGMVRNMVRDSVREYEHILPEGEYEGLFADAGGRLIALCKNCKTDDQRDEVSGYVLKDLGKGLAITDHFKVDVSGIKLNDGVKLTGGRKRGKFHPSCLARHPLTREWYIISSVNKVLLVLDEQMKVKGVYPLDPALFKQPEGLAFDAKGNMYISNEGGQGNANVLLFSYRQPK
ncbi:MAG TPA: SdiA-regulated family protein [Puia sp.]|nr:SdiA-regulated family protein [Puia sp.]